MKHTKKFNKEWAEAIALLPGEIQASLTAAIVLYQFEGIEPHGLNPIAQALFIVIKPTIDLRAHRAEYQRLRRKQRKGIMNTAPAIKLDRQKSGNHISAKAPAQKSMPATSSSAPSKSVEPSIAVTQPKNTPPVASTNRPNSFLRDVNKARNRHLAQRKNKIRM